MEKLEDENRTEEERGVFGGVLLFVFKTGDDADALVEHGGSPNAKVVVERFRIEVFGHVIFGIGMKHPPAPVGGNSAHGDVGAVANIAHMPCGWKFCDGGDSSVSDVGVERKMQLRNAPDEADFSKRLVNGYFDGFCLNFMPNITRPQIPGQLFFGIPIEVE